MVPARKKLENDEITKEQYNQWRYTYPKMEAEQTRRELTLCVKSEKLKIIQVKKANKKGLAKLISLNSVRPFLLASVGFYLITSDEKNE